MRKLLVPVLLMLLSSFCVTQAQLIDGLDATSTDTTYQLSIENAPSKITLEQNTADVKEGTSSLKYRAVIGSFHEWGSYAQLIKRVPEGEPLLDWSVSDTLAIWIKVIDAPAHPEYMVFRIHIADRPTPDDPIEEYIYEQGTVLDAAGDWQELKIPLKMITSDGSVIPADTGFVISPSNWGGFSYNNRVLDLDKIIGYNISTIVSGYTAGTNLPADSLTVLFDGFRRLGAKSIPAIIFDGKNYRGAITGIWPWGQSSYAIEEGAGAVEGTNAVKWTQGNEWGNGWSGIAHDVNPNFNLSSSWEKDSMKIKIKAEEGVGALRLQIEGGGGKMGIVFTPVTDNQYHSYSFALKDFTVQDNAPNFNAATVNSVGIMAEGTAVAGKVVYFTDWWTGNPEFDVIAPKAAEGVMATAGSRVNVVTWQDVPNETGEKYHVYYSTQPITDVTAPGVEVVKLNVVENSQLVEHLLLAPETNQNVTYYYAVICKDEAGNEGPLSANSAPLTNEAKGVATIDIDNVPVNFAADGNLGEWANVNKIHMSVFDGSAFLAPNTQITSDDDLSLDCYLAVDQTYLYVAFNVVDDVVSTDVSTDSWMNDGTDLFIGLYDWHGKPHTSYERGAEPDYHFRFNRAKAFGDGMPNGDSLLVPGENYYWSENFPSGYVVEARIALADLANKAGDNLFVPVKGMRIPLDFSINDADGAPREGILCLSPNNNDQSWGDVSRWTHTWIGDAWTGVEDENYTVSDYSLQQNYPNPFNPSTQIKYTLKEAGLVSLKVYDMLGREVASLVNQQQEAGQHTVNFNAANLSTGMYIYKIETGSFVEVKKMMLLK